MRRTYFVVEGPHDVEVINKLLRPLSLERVRNVEMLDKYWMPLVPRVFPPQGDLLSRVPVPVFLSSATHSVAIHAAGGITNVPKVAAASLFSLDHDPDSFGVIVDADDQPPEKQWHSVAGLMSGRNFGGRPGDIFEGPPRSGIYVLPDNVTPGTLEDVLVECGEAAYPTLTRRAQQWIGELDPHDNETFHSAACSRHFTKPTGRTKAVIGAVASVLRPGKAVQVSIQDNRWLEEPRALVIPKVSALQQFVIALAS